MKLILTAPDGGSVRMCIDNCIILRPDKERNPGNANAVIVTPLGNWAVLETPDMIWKMVGKS